MEGSVEARIRLKWRGVAGSSEFASLVANQLARLDGRRVRVSVVIEVEAVPKEKGLDAYGLPTLPLFPSDEMEKK